MTSPDDPRPPFEAPSSAPWQGADDALGRVLAATLDAPPSWRARLMERPTPLRVGLVGGIGLVVGGLVLGALGLRADLPGVGGALSPLVGALGVLALGSWAAALRPLDRPPLSWVAVAALALLPAVPALAGTWPGDLHGGALGGLVCGAVGLVVGVAPLLGALALDRGPGLAPWRAAAAAAGGGLLASAVEALFCSHADLPHLLVGHASVPLLLVGLGGVGARISPLRRPRQAA